MGKVSNPIYRNSLSDPSLSIPDRCAIFLKAVTHPDYIGYDAAALSTTTFTSASYGVTEWSFTVTEAMCNPAGNLHGGCAATILDDLTSTPALTMAKDGFLDNGTVSRTLSCTYLKALPLGSKVRVKCEAVGVGGTLVNFEGRMINEKGEVAVVCVHDKVVLRAKI